MEETKLRPDIEEDDLVITPIERYDIETYPADYTLRTTYDLYKSNKIIIPEFQRKFVWDKLKRSRLIESFLLGLPVPPIYFYKSPKEELLVIDGNQRIRTIIAFYENELILKGVQEPFSGKKYTDLDDTDKNYFDTSVLRSFIVRQIRPKNGSSIYHIFHRLNTGGVILTPMEIRKALFYGEFYKLLEKLNKVDTWREILGQKNEDLRLKDIELVLRCLSLTEHWKKYKSPMTEFLNKMMQTYTKSYNTTLAKRFERRFIKVCDLIINSLGSKPFHTKKGNFDKNGRINFGVLDSFFVGIAETNPKEQLLKKVYNILKNDSKYRDYITQRDATKTENLKARIEYVIRQFQVHSKC